VGLKTFVRAVVILSVLTQGHPGLISRAFERAERLIPTPAQVTRALENRNSIITRLGFLSKSVFAKTSRFLEVAKETPNHELPKPLRKGVPVDASSILRIAFDFTAGAARCSRVGDTSSHLIDLLAGDISGEIRKFIGWRKVDFVLITCCHQDLSSGLVRRAGGYMSASGVQGLTFCESSPGELPPDVSGAPVLVSARVLTEALESQDLPTLTRVRESGAWLRQFLTLVEAHGPSWQPLAVTVLHFEPCPVIVCGASSKPGANLGKQDGNSGSNVIVEPLAPTALASGFPKTALVISPIPTHPTNQGNRKRVVELGRLLHSLGFETVLAYAPSYEQTAADTHDMTEFWGNVFELSRLGPGATDHERYDAVLNFDNGKLVRSLSISYEFDLAFGVYAWTAPLVDYVDSSTRKILDSHDVLANRWTLLERLGLQPSFFNLQPVDERDFLQSFDEVWAISRCDKEVFEGYDTGQPIRLMPPTVSTIDREVTTVGRPIRFGIIASDNAINVTSVNHLLEGLLEVPASPSWRLDVAGAVCGSVPTGLRRSIIRRLGDQVSFVGRVNDLEVFYREIDVAISVARGGTGTALKAVEAISQGKALLANSWGARGLESSVDDHQLSSIAAVSERVTTMTPPEVHLLAQSSIDIARNLDSISRQTTAASLGDLVDV
jgi:hypothetical protein